MILYPENATSFTTNGLGSLSEAISCVVTEERNGIFELVMEYPVDGRLFDSLTDSKIIKCKSTPGGTDQLFRIYAITKPINGIVTVNAEHISYQLSYIPVAPFQAGSCAAAITGIGENAMTACPFTFWTDKSNAGTYKQDAPDNARIRLGGTEGSILDVYGGEYEFDNYTVKLHSARGTDRGTVLRYGKNITDIEQEENIASTYTGIVGFWINETDEIHTNVILTDNYTAFPYKRIKVVDFSSDFEEKPSAANLAAKATAYMTANNFGVPKVSISVSFVALWQTEEYKDIAPLERVWLCDTVSVFFEKLGITATAKVVKTEYNVLLDRYDRIELGELRSGLSGRMADQSSELQEVTDGMLSELQKAIRRATDRITGTTGGYLRETFDANGNPYEILIMDTPDKDTAVKLWRWNLGGLGYSSHGYNGPYGTAITMDGEIVADFITAGKMSAAIIKGGILESIETGGPNVKFDLTTGQFDLRSGKIRLGYEQTYGIKRYNFELDDDGEMRIGWNGASHKHMVVVTPDGNVTTDSSDWNLGHVEYHDGADRYNFQLTNGGEIGIGWSQSAHRYRLYYDGSAMTIYDGILKVGYIENYDGADRYRFVIDEYNNLGIGWDASAHRYGLSYDPTNGLVINGGGTFSGDISAASGTFKGKLEFYKQNDPSWLLTEINPDGEKGAIIFHGSESNNRNWKMAEIDSSGIRAMFLRIMDGTSHIYGTFSGGRNNSSEVVCSGDFIIEADGAQRSLKVSDGSLTVGGGGSFGSNVSITGDLTVSGTIHNSNSDRRLKKNIKGLSLKKAKDFIMRLVPKSFKFKRDDGRVHHGFIAQEVEEFADWGAVYDTPNSYKGIPYQEYVADLVAVVQDQEKRINDLEKRLAALERSSNDKC